MRWPWFCRTALAGALALAFGPAAGQGAPDYRLELDTGGHTAVIRALAVSADGATLLSGSEDKTGRVWPLAGAAPPAVLRGYAGPGNDGMVYAVALSPDGRFAALAGYFGPHVSPEPPFGDIRIFETGSRKLVRVLKGHDYIVDSLAYSPERDELAAAGQGGVVLRWRAPFSETPEPLPPLDSYARRISHVAYALGGARLLATTHDYGLRMWEAETGAEIEPPEAEPLWEVPLTGLAVRGDGAAFALSGADGRVEHRAAADGAVLARLPERPFRPDALAYGADGALLVGCGYRCGGEHEAELWGLEPVARLGLYRGLGGPVTAALATGGGFALAGGETPAIHLWTPGTETPRRILAGAGAPVSAVGIAPDASWIAWGRADPCPERPNCPEMLAPLTHAWDMPTGAGGFGAPHEGVPAGARRALLEAAPFRLSVGDSPATQFAGDLLAIEGGGEIRKGPTDGYVHSAVTLLPERGEVVTGGGGGLLMAHGTDGRFAGEFLGHEDRIRALAATGTLLLSGSDDQTMALWNLETREEVARLFVAGEEWLIWTPQGYYHSSPGGDGMVGWRVNRGRDEEARYVRAAELKRHLHSPEIVRRAVLTGDAGAALRDLRGSDGELDALLNRAPPDFRIRLADEIAAPEGSAVFEVTGAALEEVEAWGYAILVNDRRVPPLRYPDPAGQGRLFYQVPLEPGENAIRVTGEDDHGYITERSAMALSALREAPVPERRGVLYVAVIGVADYPGLPEACAGGPCDLAYPVDDAVEVLATLAEESGKLYERMETLVIVSPRRLEGSDRLLGRLAAVADAGAVLPPENRTVEDALIAFLARPTEEDTTVVFVAGHGLNLDEDYYLVPADAQMRNGEWRRSSLFDWQVLQEEMSYALGRRILLIDTCHAQGAYNARLEKDAADARIAVFSATAANNTAAERSDLGHGIFTYALLQGLRGAADTGGDGVRLLGLADYVYREVLRLSGQRQEPFYSLLDTSNFLLAPP